MVGDQKRVGVYRRLQRGQQHVRPDVAYQEIDLVRVDQLVGLLLTELWLELVVFVNHLDRQPAHRSANVFEPKLERIAHVFANCRSRATECAHKTDLHRLALGKCRGRRKSKRRDTGYQFQSHDVYPR